MELLEDLKNRSDSICELCGATANLVVYEVPNHLKGASKRLLKNMRSM